MNYLDENDHTAAITAEISDNTVRNIELEDNKEFPVWLLPLILAALIGTLLYKKYTTREIAYDQIVVTELPEPFDYKAAARTMLDEAVALFEEKKYKEAYSRAGQAVRLCLRYKQGLDRGITNDEIIHYLRTQG